MILGVVALSMLIVGTILAVRAENRVERAAQLELLGGILIVGGLSLVGVGIACALNPITSGSM